MIDSGASRLRLHQAGVDRPHHPLSLTHINPTSITGQLVALLFPVQHLDTPPPKLNTQEGPPFEVSGPLYTELLEGSLGEDQDGLLLERLELSGPCPQSIKPRRGREWLGRWRRPG